MSMAPHYDNDAAIATRREKRLSNHITALEELKAEDVSEIQRQLNEAKAEYNNDLEIAKNSFGKDMSKASKSLELNDQSMSNKMNEKRRIQTLKARLINGEDSIDIDQLDKLNVQEKLLDEEILSIEKENAKLTTKLKNIENKRDELRHQAAVKYETKAQPLREDLKETTRTWDNALPHLYALQKNEPSCGCAPILSLILDRKKKRQKVCTSSEDPDPKTAAIVGYHAP